MNTNKIISIFGILIFTVNSCCMQKIGLYRNVTFKKKTDNDELIMVNSSHLQKSYTLSCKDIEYYICTNKLNFITYISTIDSDFVTPEGIKMGMHVKNIMSNEQYELIFERGFGYFLELPSGWNVYFGYNFNNPEEMPNDSTVKMFYKKK